MFPPYCEKPSFTPTYSNQYSYTVVYIFDPDDGGAKFLQNIKDSPNETNQVRHY